MLWLIKTIERQLFTPETAPLVLQVHMLQINRVSYVVLISAQIQCNKDGKVKDDLNKL